MGTSQGGTEAQDSTVNAKALASARSRVNLVRHRLLELNAVLLEAQAASIVSWAERQLELAREEMVPNGQDEASPF